MHLVSDIWGTLAVNLFGERRRLPPQLIGVDAVGATYFVSAFLLFIALDTTLRLPVSRAPGGPTG